ncbi:MAG: hypothetical protein JETCAE02_17650 [Anaerolineaceae bacterium]|jgi:hypothetical protein|nr:hypothetical protein [Anaerolineae bacterium]MBL1171190.1 hypothetical protein [Chloroflexota bacterium]MBV6467029.1 hypothetical protein [Anaerolineales bacterium]MCE7904229.1 hypothetical protein [Anaerolineae bacterium CFX3]MDL1924912.1 hypothetical protein [Anaerolineae bacterium AMX1]OQY80213.1 MAG: hypothetical protein B6D40_13365 [Anaerolineae bacterium UTCFX3]GER79852.1 conserved hypothetical protein [Candidatus Denitrolinea symbiosum]GJQ39353.1 MAG: hypothetical protein JETCAE02_
MYTPGPEDKVTLVMAYTQNGLIRGEVVTMKTMRINNWLRTDSAPDYFHFYNLQWLQMTAGGIKSAAYQELILPVSQAIGFHAAPPSQEPLDYDEREDRRVNKPVTIHMGLFTVNGYFRAASQSDLLTTLSVSHSAWMSIYDASVSSPYIPQMPPIQVSMMLARSEQIGFILQD